jgi:ketosteroid isomerase-like protein
MHTVMVLAWVGAGMASDLRGTLERYFQALDDADFETAAAQFSPDVTYVHPPMYGDEAHIHGRDELLSYFTDVRGRTDSLHHVDRALADDDACAAVGYMTTRDGDEPLEWFVSYATFDGDHMDYYIAGLLGME